MFEHFLPFIVTAVLGFMVQPPITEVGFHGGPYWPDTSDSEMHMTVGATAHTPLGDRFGIQLGAGYTKRGRSWSCWKVFCEFVGMSLLGQARLPLDDSVDLRAVLGPSYGVEVWCRRESRTQGTAEGCSSPVARSEVPLVAGIGVAIQASRRVGMTVDYRYGFDLREWGSWDWLDRSEGIFESSLTAGITYRIAR